MGIIVGIIVGICSCCCCVDNEFGKGWDVDAAVTLAPDEERVRFVFCAIRTSHWNVKPHVSINNRGSLLPTREDTEGVGAPHQCPRVIKNEVDWGSLSPGNFKKNSFSAAKLSAAVVVSVHEHASFGFPKPSVQ